MSVTVDHTFIIRPAVEADSASIRSLVRSARINPTGLDWRRFILAENAHGHVIGCGQVKAHRDGAQELASIAVLEGWRGRGVGRAIILHLLSLYPPPLYLTCRASLQPFYEQFGFRAIPQALMPPYFRRIYRIFQLLKRFRVMQEDLVVMQYSSAYT